MSIQLPGFLSEVLGLVGVKWPDIEEDDLRSVGTLLDQLTGNVRDHRDSVTGQLQATGSMTSATSFDALVEHWSQVGHGPLESSLGVIEDISQGLHIAADLVVVCKVGVIGELTRLQAEIAAAEASLFGAAAIPGLVAASRVIIGRLIQILEAEAISKITNELFGKLIDEVESGVQNMVYRGVTGLVHV